MSDVSPLSGISGLSFDSALLSLSLSLFFLPRSAAFSVSSFFCLLAHSAELFFSSENSSVFFGYEIGFFVWLLFSS